MPQSKKKSIEQLIADGAKIIFIIFAIGCAVSFIIPPIGQISWVWLNFGTAALTAYLVATAIKIYNSRNENKQQ